MLERFDEEGMGQQQSRQVGIFGDLAVGLCTIAVAPVGFLMLTGRLPLRRGGLVVLGVFLLLGAPAVAASLVDLARPSPVAAPVQAVIAEPGLPPREPLPPA